MNLEDIKSYKDACKIINRKPRRYRDNHINIYEQLSTITAAVNYIETGTQWKHIVKPNNEFYEIYYWKTFSTHSNDKSDKGLFSLYSDGGVGCSDADVGSDLRFATARGAEYVKTTFEILLRQWFDPDSIKQQGTALAVLFICLINKLKYMQQLVTISFAIKNTKEERNKIIKYMNRHFSIPVQETNNLLDIAYIAELVYFRAIDFELDFPDEYTEEDMFKKLKIALPDVSFTCQINNKTFEHDISIKPENKKVEPTNRNTTNISVTIEKALKEEFVIIHRKDLEKLKRTENGLKDLLGTIENLNNKLKTLSNDIRTISES